MSSGGPAGTSGIVEPVDRLEDEAARALPLDPNLNTVFVLGAGFSRPLGGLLLDQLLDDLGREFVRHLFPGGSEENLSFWDGMWIARRLCQAGIQHRLWANAEEYLETLESAARCGADSATWAAAALRTVQQHKLWYEPRGNPKAADFVGCGPLVDAVRYARLAVAADCEVFLRGAEPAQQERWRPYLRWARELRGNHSIITFNYDRVPDILAEQKGTRLRIITPGQAESPKTQAFHASRELYAPTFKLHGSTTWVRDKHRRHVMIQGDFEAQIRSKDGSEFLIGVPGPAKVELSEENRGPLWGLWDAAAASLKDAEAIVFIGYRFPESDAQARGWLLDALRTNRTKDQKSLLVYTVLGSDVGSSNRLRYMIEAILGARVVVEQLPLVTQEFFDVAWG
jgi:hypothetical protein